MKISTFFYILRQGFANIRRNILFSLASIGTIISCLFLFGIIYAVVVNFQSGMQELESTVTISVFFDEDTSDETIQLIGEQIRTLDYVNTMDFVSADQAWDNFVKQNYDNPQAAKDAFGDDNPLKNAASYEVTLKDVSKQPEFVAFAQGLSGVRKVKSSDVTADSITTLSSLVGYASIGIVVILMLVSIFLISNTITIGATNVFVRAPFIIEGVIIGAVGSAIPLVLLYYMYDKILTYVAGRFQVVTTLFAFVSQKELFSTMVPVGLVLGIGVGLVGSILTTRKHLRV